MRFLNCLVWVKDNQNNKKSFNENWGNELRFMVKVNGRLIDTSIVTLNKECNWTQVSTVGQDKSVSPNSLSVWFDLREPFK